MSEVKLCANGHYYASVELQCPYCPKPAGQAAASSSQPKVGAFINAGKTQVFNYPDGPSGDKGAGTQMFNGSDENKTQIFSSNSTPANGQQPSKVRGQKLVGWLVTYDFNAMGRDYRLCEGRNTIGHAKEREVVVDFDTKVSSHHCTVLYRLGEFLFKDELSTNGTFHNGVLMNEGSLKDGDELRVGATTFLFRTALK